MKSRLLAMLTLILVAAAPVLVTATSALATPAPASAPAPKTPTAYLSEAQALANGGKLAEAITLLQQAAKDYPQSSDIFAYLGMYVGRSAGQAKDFMEAGRLTTESFTILDKAVGLGP